MRRVARRIQQARASKGVTQEELAAALHMAARNLQRIESGQQNLTLETIARIAAKLKMEPEEILSRSTIK